MNGTIYLKSSYHFAKLSLKLLRIKHWVKNSFLFIPLFFAGEIFNIEKLILLGLGFIAFGFVASGIYVLNDYRDIEADRKHPKKCKRPLASGEVSKRSGIVLMFLCFIAGLAGAILIDPKFAFIVFLYVAINVSYCFGLKHIAILDVMLVSLGFVLRIKGGGVIAEVPVSMWLIIMVYLLALFMAFAKRRDDVLINLKTGQEMRKASRNYNLDFLNAVIILISTISIVAYMMYAVSPEVMVRLGTYRIYYTSIFVIAGMIRYLQIIYVFNDTGSPTSLLYKDRFIQASIILWILSFYLLIYIPDIIIF